MYSYKHYYNIIHLFIIVLLFYFKYKFIGIFSIILLLFLYRNPIPIKSNRKNIIISPVYGKIKSIKVKDNLITINITKNIFDPHIYYAPITGHIYHKNNNEIVFKNKNTVTIKSKNQKYWYNINDYIRNGTYYGINIFGSNIEISFYKNKYQKLVVYNGQKLLGGRTIILS